MRLIIVTLIITVALTAVDSKKWSDTQYDNHKSHKGKDYTHEHRKKEKEEYYRMKHFDAAFDHKDIMKHSPITVSEYDAKLQADVDDYRKVSRPEDLHLQALDHHHRERTEKPLFKDHEKKLNNEKRNHNHEPKKHHHFDLEKEFKFSNFKDKMSDEEHAIVNKRGKKERKQKYKRQENGKNHDKRKKKYSYKKKRDGKKYKLTVYGKS